MIIDIRSPASESVYQYHLPAPVFAYVVIAAAVAAGTWVWAFSRGDSGKPPDQGEEEEGNLHLMTLPGLGPKA
jgi:hypothetical protein